MRTLAEAWGWYRAVAEGMKWLTHLSSHWGRMPDRGENEWVDQLLLDNVLRNLEPDEIARGAKSADDPLADLAVLVLFSVFESIVRGAVHDQVTSEIVNLRHPALIHAAEETLSAIDEGSFFRVLEPYKGGDAGLVEEVNQVRRYRNWVAHGRRGDPPGNPPIRIDPRTAYDRLTRLLDTIHPQSAPT